MASHESIPCRILPNPYDNDYFYNKSSLRDRDFIFVGRLIEQKGLMILLKAFVVLSKDGDCSLTIIGEGSQKEIGEDYVRKIGLEDRVDFLGHQDAPQVANQMRRHKVVVVPSIWEEPFGLVVLEGLACGCRVVAANRGGIPEGLNGLGILYEAEDVADLARALREQLSESVLMPEKQALCQHLEWHQPANVAMEYENLLLKN
ncbi:MAG: glycosyltransferase family 4 protein [Pontiella sp.]